MSLFMPLLILTVAIFKFDLFTLNKYYIVLGVGKLRMNNCLVHYLFL